MEDQVAAGAAEVLSAAQEALASDERTADLAAAVPDPADATPPRIALVGPYSAGKSLLIAALLQMTDEEAETISAATPHTAEITPYPWRERELLDLPGTLSGIAGHDDVARAGLRTADALVAVTTVELPGEEETAALRAALDEDGFRGRSVVVVNKVGSENSDRQVIADEVSDRIGDLNGVRVVFTDARDHLDSLNEPALTSEDRALLAADSGISDLEDALEQLFSGPKHPREEAQLHEAARLLRDGLSLWEPTASEDLIETTAARIQSTVDAAQAQCAEATEQALDALGPGIRAIGADLAAAVDPRTGQLPEAAANAADAEEERFLQQFTDAVNGAVSDVVDRLGRDLEASFATQERLTRSLGARGSRRHVDGAPVESGRTDKLVEAVRERLAETGSHQLKRLVERGARPGAPLHSFARKLNSLLGKTPKPYVHVHTAERLKTGLKISNVAIELLGPALDVGSLIDDAVRIRRISDRRLAARKRYERLAEALVTEERRRATDHVRAQLAPYVELVALQISQAAELAASREAGQARLTAVLEQLGRYLTDTSGQGGPTHR